MDRPGEELGRREFFRRATQAAAIGAVATGIGCRVIPKEKGTDRADAMPTRVIGMRLNEEVDANIKILSDDAPYTADDRGLLAEFSVKALDRNPLRKMRVD
jgi:hypothetical protein